MKSKLIKFSYVEVVADWADWASIKGWLIDNKLYVDKDTACDILNNLHWSWQYLNHIFSCEIIKNHHVTVKPRLLSQLVGYPTKESEIVYDSEGNQQIKALQQLSFYMFKHNNVVYDITDIIPNFQPNVLCRFEVYKVDNYQRFKIC